MMKRKNKKKSTVHLQNLPPTSAAAIYRAMAGPLFAANRQGLSYVSCSTCMDEVEGYDVVALQETYLL